jgi:uncharacterized OsmC-like protein
MAAPRPNVARAYPSGIFGRCLASSGAHHWVVDHAPQLDGPGEQPGTVEYFLSGIVSCAVLMLEREAKLRGIPFRWLDATIEASGRHHAQGEDGPVTFQAIDLQLDFIGPSEDQAQELVQHYRTH